MVVISNVLWGSVGFCLGNLYPTVALFLWGKTSRETVKPPCLQAGSGFPVFGE